LNAPKTDLLTDVDISMECEPLINGICSDIVNDDASSCSDESDKSDLENDDFFANADVNEINDNGCCSCNKTDVLASNHFCSVTSKRVHAFCYPSDADPETTEKYGSRAPCARCSFSLNHPVAFTATENITRSSMKRVQSDQNSGKPVITPIDRQVASISHSFVSDPDATHDATQTFGNNINFYSKMYSSSFCGIIMSDTYTQYTVISEQRDINIMDHITIAHIIQANIYPDCSPQVIISLLTQGKCFTGSKAGHCLPLCACLHFFN
jgi:hypothetical protein